MNGYSGYQVNNFGKIRSLKNNKIKEIKQTDNNYGYLCATLCSNGKLKTEKVHRIVAKTFIPNPDNKPTVNHKNGIKTDNRIENLEWATYQEQKKHAIENNLCKLNIENLKNANVKRSIRILYNGVLYNSIREASRETGICQWSIKHKGIEVM